MRTYKILPQEDQKTAKARFAKDVFLGLMRSRKMLQSKYMYDDRGSEIYEEIMNLDEYYLVSAELDCINNSKEELSMILSDQDFNIVELGAGNGYKTRHLLEQFVRDDRSFTYVPVDISEGAMKSLIADFEQSLPEVRISGIVGDYFDALKYLSDTQLGGKRNIVLFLGSSIGNFDVNGATDFIFSLWRTLNNEDLIFMGFDLRKEIQSMLNAYNDKKGITAEFNYNLLRRINRELGGNFDLTKFTHYEPYNIYTGAMESYLISLEDQEVYIEELRKSFHFRKWEAIFVEHSYKYTLEDIENLASITGCSVLHNFFDTQKRYVNSLWCVHRK